MSTYQRSIVSIIEPTIKVDEIAVEDSESKKAKDNQSDALKDNPPPKYSSRFGAYIPLIQINSLKFDTSDIIRMSMSLTSNIPTISISVKDDEAKLDINAPLDGDVISLYLRPPDADNQRPIRIDFDITDISSNPTFKIYNFTGVMKIPGIYKELCKSFPSDTSFQHLQTICEDLGLGFASNETTTDDTMTRICPFDTYERFIADVVETSYKDDDSFFDWYIDPYYYLCMVNLNKQFSLEDKIEEVNISMNAPLSGMQGMEDAQDSIKGGLVLTNQAEKSGFNIFIESFSVANKAGKTWMSNGYKRYASWWNIAQSESTYEEVFVDPLTTPGAENDFILLKGRRDEDFYKDQVKYKWLGKQAPLSEQGNVHDNFQFCKILNLQNMKEMQKTVLNVELSGMNFYIYKYMRIPVIIYTQGDTKKSLEMKDRNDALGETGKTPNSANSEGFNSTASNRPGDSGNPENVANSPLNQIKNEFLSGYYIVGDIEYVYSSPGPVKQRLTLIRREWPIPAKNKDQ